MLVISKVKDGLILGGVAVGIGIGLILASAYRIKSKNKMFLIGKGIYGHHPSQCPSHEPDVSV